MQFALPLPALVLVAVLVAVGILAIAAIGFWVYRDASLRGSSQPIAWAVGAMLPTAGVAVLVGYLLVRQDIGERTAPRSRLETACLSLYLGLVGAFVVGAVLAPPDPFTQLLYFVPALAVTVPAAYLVLAGLPGRVTYSA